MTTEVMKASGELKICDEIMRFQSKTNVQSANIRHQNKKGPR